MALSSIPDITLDRRRWLRWAALAGLGALGCRRAGPPAVETPADAPLRFPGKVAMRVINDRPPCLETPWSYYREDLTPNEAFYVRWHLQVIPTTVDLRTWRLKVGGHVEKPLELSMDDLRHMGGASVVAVNQCSGNSRGLSDPSVPGAQWRNGGMGNARWEGVRLRDLLKSAGVKAGAVEVSFLGLDRGGMPGVPDFVKSLSVERAEHADVLLAYQMNGEPVPLLNGFPLRLIVPGWYATYWVKALTDITVLPQRFDGFWMSKAYRIPTTPNAVEEPDKLAKDTVPIHRMNVRSFFAAPDEGSRLPAGRACNLDGVAFDGGDGIKRVQVSADGGRTWMDAELGDDLGVYSFRRWRLNWTPQTRGPHVLQVRATSNTGETQPDQAGWNRSGYMRNVIEQLSVEVV
jgi:DMSO/TMAO reductase YedYZ molybdopterin-dependent catalytic subunit